LGYPGNPPVSRLPATKVTTSAFIHLVRFIKGASIKKKVLRELKGVLHTSYGLLPSAHISDALPPKEKAQSKRNEIIISSSDLGVHVRTFI
jgi:hypothetical protein